MTYLPLSLLGVLRGDALDIHFVNFHVISASYNNKKLQGGRITTKATLALAQSDHPVDIKGITVQHIQQREWQLDQSRQTHGREIRFRRSRSTKRAAYAGISPEKANYQKIGTLREHQDISNRGEVQLDVKLHGEFELPA